MVSFFPPLEKGKHPRKVYVRLPKNLKKLYREVVAAYNDNLHLLCAAGLRALLEGTCADKGIEEGPNSSS